MLPLKTRRAIAQGATLLDEVKHDSSRFGGELRAIKFNHNISKGSCATKEKPGYFVGAAAFRFWQLAC